MRTSDHMDRCRCEKSQRGKEKRRENNRRDRVRRKNDAGARKGWQVAIHCAFPMICVSGRSKGRLALRRRLRRHLARREMRSCTPLLREAELAVKCTEHHMFGPLVAVLDVDSISKPDVLNKLRWYPHQPQYLISQTFSGTVEPDLALHQGFLEPSPEPSSEHC